MKTALWTCLAAVLIALPAWAQSPAPSPDRLQALVNDTAVQFRLAYHHNLAEHQRRHEQLGRAVAAWRSAPRRAANNELLAEWLRAAMRSSMPGSRQPLPPLPEFGHAPATPAVAAPPPRPAAATTRKKPVTSQRPRSDRPVVGATLGHGSTAGDPPAAHPPLAPQAESVPAAREEDDLFGPNFWRAHPAARDLPAELMKGDPFRDDPLPGQEMGATEAE